MRRDVTQTVGLLREAIERSPDELQEVDYTPVAHGHSPATVSPITTGYCATAKSDPAPSRQRPGSWRTHLTTPGGNA